MKKFKVAVVGATGTVGQRFVELLAAHPWFEPCALAASSASANKTYEEAVSGRWVLPSPIPAYARDMVLFDAEDVNALSGVDFVFCAVGASKERVKALEEKYARAEIPVISNNSAHRFTPDVPMVIPEVNPGHLEVIPRQRARLRTSRGFVAVKSNCSLQSYVPLLHPLREFEIRDVVVCTYQAVSGAGKTPETMPEICDNVIPFIGGEEEKSEREPLKIWGQVKDGEIVPAALPRISAQCVRVPVSDGHTAAVSVRFGKMPKREDILARWEGFSGEPQRLHLPSAPAKFLHYFGEEDRPQPRLDRDLERGMAISAGRLREDPVLGWKFFGCSHNTLRGAAGGAVLLAELLAAKGYLG